MYFKSHQSHTIRLFSQTHTHHLSHGFCRGPQHLPMITVIRLGVEPAWPCHRAQFSSSLAKWVLSGCWFQLSKNDPANVLTIPSEWFGDFLGSVKPKSRNIPCDDDYLYIHIFIHRWLFIAMLKYRSAVSFCQLCYLARILTMNCGR